MKTLTLSLLSLFAIAVIQAQDYQISFTGSGQSTTVDSIQVKNLTQGTTLTLSGDDVLHLVNNVGIHSMTDHLNNLKIYPNPMVTSTLVEFVNSNAGQVCIEICNEMGVLTAKQSMWVQQGNQRFEISSIKAGIYTLNVSSADSKYAAKLISLGNSQGNISINHQGTDERSVPENVLKSTNALVQMQYNDGEKILFKGFAGNYARVLTLLPTQSQIVNFEFIPCIDEDGNSYSVVTIGNQTWMAENLKTTKYNNGTDIPIVTDITTWINLTTSAYCWYNNDQVSFGSKYGALYNWYSVESNNLCPTGWHVPAKSEWGILTDFLGGSNVAGGKLKEIGTTHWNNPNTDATNESGFTALPGGSRNDFDGNYVSNGLWGGWWTATVVGTSNAWTLKLRYSDGTVYWPFYHFQSGYSVRCLRN